MAPSYKKALVHQLQLKHGDGPCLKSPGHAKNAISSPHRYPPLLIPIVRCPRPLAPHIFLLWLFRGVLDRWSQCSRPSVRHPCDPWEILMGFGKLRMSGRLRRDRRASELTCCVTIPALSVLSPRFHAIAMMGKILCV